MKILDIVNTFKGNFKLKGKDKFETTENYSILFIFMGAILFSLGTGLTIFSPQGIPAIFALLGSLIAFVFTVIWIFSLLVKEFYGD